MSSVNALWIFCVSRSVMIRSSMRLWTSALSKGGICDALHELVAGGAIFVRLVRVPRPSRAENDAHGLRGVEASLATEVGIVPVDDLEDPGLARREGSTGLGDTGRGTVFATPTGSREPDVAIAVGDATSVSAHRQDRAAQSIESR